LLLDEPSLACRRRLVDQIPRRDRRRAERMASPCCWLEQNSAAALEIADRGFVLETGRVALEGPAAALLSDPKVKAAYLGAD